MNTGDAAADAARLRRAGAAVGLFVATLWVIHVAATIGAWDLAALGVRPRTAAGLVGVLAAPLVHGSGAHLLGNTLPLLVLGAAVLYDSPRATAVAVPVIWLGSGTGVWLFARASVHLGASGLAYGLLFFVLAAGMLRRDRRSVALALVVLFVHGGMLWGLLPLRAGVSFESHIAGAVAGLICAFALRERDPRPRRRKYAWEGEEIDLEHPAADLFLDRADNDESERSRRDHRGRSEL